MNCIYFKKRRKNYVGYNYCTIRRCKIEYEECKHCNKKEYRRVKPIKPASKKRITVSKETYEAVAKRDKHRCRICGTTQNLHLHHIDGRGKYKTNDIDNCIMLCQNCHLNIVHKNNKYWRQRLKELI